MEIILPGVRGGDLKMELLRLEPISSVVFLLADQWVHLNCPVGVIQIFATSSSYWSYIFFLVVC